MNVRFSMIIMVCISLFATIGVLYFSSRVSSGYAKDLRKVFIKNYDRKYFIHKI